MLGIGPGCCCTENAPACSACPNTTLPTTIRVSVTNPGFNFNILQSCTLTWRQPVPPALRAGALSALASGYFSTGAFSDTINPAAYFYYYLYCGIDLGHSPSFFLTRVYPAQPTFPAGFVESDFRYKWPFPPFTANTCNPLSLTSGAIFNGGDTRTVATATG